jgi:hypothetical protein
MIVIEVQSDTKAEADALKDAIPGAAVNVPRPFSGSDAIVQIVVPIVTASIPLVIEFVKARLREKKFVTIKHNGVELVVSVNDVADVLGKLPKDS